MGQSGGTLVNQERQGDYHSIQNTTHLVILQKVEYKFNDNIIFKSKHISDALSDPWFNGVQTHTTHVHLYTQKPGNTVLITL